MVDLFSSSPKFTSGTWEDFVCHLPNITHDVITDIKKRSKEGDPNDDQLKSAVAEHCLNKNPELTWKDVTIGLLLADEIGFACLILEKHSGKYYRVEAGIMGRVVLWDTACNFNAFNISNQSIFNSHN